MTRPATELPARLSTLRLVSFVPRERDGVHVGLLTPDAQHVVDLAHLGITDVLEAIGQLETLRRAAGAIVHGPSRTAHAVSDVHLVASLPLARSVVVLGDSALVSFADPATLHGPGSHLTRTDALTARVGLAAVVGQTVKATAHCGDDVLVDALVGSTIILGWLQHGAEPEPVLRPGAVGPFLGVPRRHPESVMITRVAPIGTPDAPDAQQILPAPDDRQFFAAARAALRTHALHPGDLITIFPDESAAPALSQVDSGSWVRVSAPGLGTLSLAVL
jgi:hypothetical protein